MSFLIRKAGVRDVGPIHDLLMGYADQGLLLPRSFSDLYGHVRDFFVLAPESGPVKGCCALSVVWEDIAEIRSLAVAQEERKKGWGQGLVRVCLDEAVSLGLDRVFILTYETKFFERFGFSEVSKDVLPQKVWADCLNCPKFPDCDETAMLLSLKPEPPR
ncbi:MAG: N-acetyltransferase [Thermodesulfobacteriota bacterium]|nr:N-acetyltransferase [Thermodesulfobacteriota bacterium]